MMANLARSDTYSSSLSSRLDRAEHQSTRRAANCGSKLVIYTLLDYLQPAMTQAVLNRPASPSMAEFDDTVSEPEEGREGLWDRITTLLAEDSVAHALFIVASLLYYLDIQLPSTLLMSLLPAIVGALLVLDYCEGVKEEVAKAAVRSGLDELLTVDRALQFSSESLQASYHAWMDKLPAVKSHSLFSLLSMQLLVHVALASKGEEFGCTWKEQSLGFPTTAILVAQTILSHYKAPMVVQSMLGLVGCVAVKALGAAAVAYKNPCVSSMLDLGHESPWMISLGTVFHTLGTHIGYRVDMQHFGVFSVAVFVVITAFTYFRYLNQNNGSDPYLWGLGLVAFSNAVATEIAVVARYAMANMNMKCFLSQVQLRKQLRALHQD